MNARPKNAPGGRMASRNVLSGIICKPVLENELPNNKSNWAKSVPEPMISRIEPNNTKINIKPMPIARASKILLNKPFFEAKLSARPIMTQLVTIKGTKIPSNKYSSKNKECIRISTVVTVQAIISIKIGILISGLI